MCKLLKHPFHYVRPRAGETGSRPRQPGPNEGLVFVTARTRSLGLPIQPDKRPMLDPGPPPPKPTTAIPFQRSSPSLFAVIKLPNLGTAAPANTPKEAQDPTRTFRSEGKSWLLRKANMRPAGNLRESFPSNLHGTRSHFPGRSRMWTALPCQRLGSGGGS